MSNIRATKHGGKKRVRRKSRSRRVSYMLDEQTIFDLVAVQSGLRAASASEAVRRAIRTMAVLVHSVEQGNTVHIVDATGVKPPVVIDIPAQVLVVSKATIEKEVV